MNPHQHNAPPHTSEASPEWIAGRIETLLSHYFVPNQSEQVAQAAMVDWIRILGGIPKQAISEAADAYLRDQPNRRPTPADIANRAKETAKKARRLSIAGPTRLSDVQIEVVDWAVETGRLGRSDAVSAVTNWPDDFPDWLPELEVHRCMYSVRHHPRYIAKEARK